MIRYLIFSLVCSTGSPPQTGTGTLIVTLNDVNDNFPEFAEDYKPVIYENEKEGMTVVTISAIDKDTASNGPPFEFWLPCHGACPCSQNPTCADFGFKFIPGWWSFTYKLFQWFNAKLSYLTCISCGDWIAFALNTQFNGSKHRGYFNIEISSDWSRNFIYQLFNMLSCFKDDKRYIHISQSYLECDPSNEWHEFH